MTCILGFLGVLALLVYISDVLGVIMMCNLGTRLIFLVTCRVLVCDPSVSLCRFRPFSRRSIV